VCERSSARDLPAVAWLNRDLGTDKIYANRIWESVLRCIQRMAMKAPLDRYYSGAPTTRTRPVVRLED
jgi:hypothetical protein